MVSTGYLYDWLLALKEINAPLQRSDRAFRTCGWKPGTIKKGRSVWAYRPFLFQTQRSDMFAAFHLHLRRAVAMIMVIRLDHRHFLAIAIMQLAVTEVIAFTQRGEIAITQRALFGCGEHRLLIRVAGCEVVEGQIEQDRHDCR